MYFLKVASGISPSTASVCVCALRWTFITWRASVCKQNQATNSALALKRVASRHGASPHHVSLLVVLVLDDEDHVEARQDGGHEVDVVLAFGVVPAAEDGVGSRQHRAAGVQGGGDAGLKDADCQHFLGLEEEVKLKAVP